MLRSTRHRFLALAAITGAIAAFGQLSPNTKITDFQVPLFNEEGNRTWQLRGEVVTYQSASQIKIEGMEVYQLSGDAVDNREVATLTSPEAIFHFDSTTAYGPGQLRVKTDAFEIVGYDWIWLGEKRQITFNNTVKVTLQGGIGDILK